MKLFIYQSDQADSFTAGEGVPSLLIVVQKRVGVFVLGSSLDAGTRSSCWELVIPLVFALTISDETSVVEVRFGWKRSQWTRCVLFSSRCGSYLLRACTGGKTIAPGTG